MAHASNTPSLRDLAATDARKYGVPADVFLRQINQESGFNPNARSGAGAEGIAQFMPATARGFGLTNPLDPVASLDAAARYDAGLMHKYGSIARALSAYNSGRPDAYLDPRFASGQTYNYVRSILGGSGPLAGAASDPAGFAAVGGASSAPRPPAPSAAAGSSGPTGLERLLAQTIGQTNQSFGLGGGGIASLLLSHMGGR